MRLSRIIYGSFLLFLVIMLPVLAGFMISCRPAVETEVAAQAEGLCDSPIPETGTMNTSGSETMALKQYGIPPIDAAAPGQTMTATFSLG
jgi:hypothetical protein